MGNEPKSKQLGECKPNLGKRNDLHANKKGQQKTNNQKKKQKVTNKLNDEENEDLERTAVI